MTDELAEYVLPPNLQWLLDPPPGSSSPSSPEEPLPTLNHIMLPLPAKGISLTWKPSITSNYNRSETQPRKAGIRLEVADQPIKVSSHDDEDVDAATEPEDEDGGTPPPSHPLPAASTIQAPFDNFVHLPPPERKAAAPPDPKPMLTFNQRGIRSRTLTSDIVLLDQQEEQPKDRPAPPSTKPKQSQSSTAKNPVLPVRFTLNAIFRLSQVRKSTVTLSDLQSRPTSNESVFTNLTVLEQGGKPKEVEDDFWVTPKERSIDLPDDDFRDDQEKEPLASSSISPSPHDGQRFPRPAFDALAAPALADRSFVYRKARGFGPRRDNSSQPTLDVTASSPGSASQAETTTVESIRLLPDPLGSLTGPETFHHPETPKSLPSPCPNTHLLLGSSVFELHIPSLSFGPDLTITLPLSCSNPDVPLQCPETDLPAPLAQPPRFSHTSSALSSSNLLGSPIPNRSSVSNHRTTQLHFTYKDDLLLSSICKDMSLNGDNLMSTMACLELGDCLVIQTSAQPTPRQKGRAMGSPVTLLIYHDETTAHCSLGCYRKTLHAVHYYDSMTSLQLEEKARQACFQMLHRLGLTTSEISWQSKVRPRLTFISAAHNERTNSNDSIVLNKKTLLAVDSTCSRTCAQSLPASLFRCISTSISSYCPIPHP